jgi:hypothetical protein
MVFGAPDQVSDDEVPIICLHVASPPRPSACGAAASPAGSDGAVPIPRLFRRPALVLWSDDAAIPSWDHFFSSRSICFHCWRCSALPFSRVYVCQSRMGYTARSGSKFIIDVRRRGSLMGRSRGGGDVQTRKREIVIVDQALSVRRASAGGVQPAVCGRNGSVGDSKGEPRMVEETTSGGGFQTVHGSSGVLCIL